MSTETTGTAVGDPIEAVISPAIVNNVMDVLFAQKSTDALTQVRINEHRGWALRVLLRTFGEQENVDYAVRGTLIHRADTFPLQLAAELAALGASKEMLEELIPMLAKEGYRVQAGGLAKLAGRRLKPEEVDLLVENYLKGAIYSTSTEEWLVAIAATCNPDARERYRLAFKKRRDDDVPY